MFKKLIRLIFRALIWAAHRSYGIEGINALLLIMPAKLIIPTLRKYGASIGENTVLHSPLIIHNAGKDYSNLRIGNDCYAGREVFLDLKDKIEIGDRVTLSMRVTLITHTDVGDSSIKKSVPSSHAPVKIESDAYLGANATILQSIRIGTGALVGAGSLVLKDVQAHTIAAGNPAREIRKI